MAGVEGPAVGVAVTSPPVLVLEELNPPQAAMRTSAAAIAATIAAMVRESTFLGYGLSLPLSLISRLARRPSAGNSGSIPSAKRAAITGSIHCSTMAMSGFNTRR